MSQSGFVVPPLPNPGRWDRPVREPSAEDRWKARLANEAPRIPWDKFITQLFTWKHGEHIGLVGPTGQGKTTMLETLLPLHPYVVAFATKPRDESMTRLIEHGGYIRLQKWERLPVTRAPRRVLWPPARDLHSSGLQTAVFRDAMERIYLEHGWTVAIDELWVFTELLHLETEVKTYLFQARSLGISLLAATQRPVDVPLALYDQSTHLFFWRDNDEANLRRLAGISWLSGDMIRRTVANLEQYQVLYINTRTGAMARTRAPAPTPLRTGRRSSK